MDNFDEQETDSFGKLSKINSAVIVNITLNDLWVDFFKHFRAGKFLSANNDLDCIWTILGGEKDIEGKTIEEEYTQIQKKLGKISPLLNSIPTSGFNKVPELIEKLLRIQKKILSEKSLFLRRLQNEQGKGTAYHEGDEDYMD